MDDKSTAPDKWLMAEDEGCRPESVVGALLEAKSEQQNNWCKVLCIAPGSDLNFGIGSNEKLILLR